MDVEKRLAADAEVFAGEAGDTDIPAFLERVFAAIDALDDPHPSATKNAVDSAGRLCAAGRAPAQQIERRDLEQEQEQDWVVRELRLRQRDAAEKGDDAWSCRRVAELLEILDHNHEAEEWWRRAAAAGDIGAQDYVEECLNS